MRRAFTLIELLVVISITALLIAILLPALSKARESAKQTACTSNLRQCGIAAQAWASDSKGKFPAGQPVLGTGGAFAIYFKNVPPDPEFPAEGQYRGHGALAAQGYMGDGSAFYCPSNVYEGAQYGKQSALLPQGGGWMQEDQIPASMRFIWSSYLYRSSFEAPDFRPAKETDPSDASLLADFFADPDNGRDINQHHQKWYNVLHLDGHVSTFSDTQEFVRGYNGGNSYFNNHNLMEEVWNIFSHGEIP